MKYLYEKDIILVSKINLKSLETLVDLYKEELETYYRRDFFDDMFSDNKELLAYVKESYPNIDNIQILEFENTSIYTGLYSLANSLNKGIRLKSRKIKFDMKQLQVSEYFDLSPYKLKAEFALILCDNAARLIDELGDENNFTHIAYLTSDKQKLIIDREVVQYISKYDESLYKLLRKERV